MVVLRIVFFTGRHIQQDHIGDLSIKILLFGGLRDKKRVTTPQKANVKHPKWRFPVDSVFLFAAFW